jgi:integrase
LEINDERKCEREFKITNYTLNSTYNPIDENHRAYVNFVSSLKSPITRKAYVIRLKNYLRSPIISFSTFDELLSRERLVIEQELIDILINMRHKMNLSFSAQNIFLCALTHFFSINDVTINRKKIKKFMSDSENKYEYRSYTAEEIGRLLSISDERERAIILLLSSTGMRVGAVHPLRLKDLKRWKTDKQDSYIYQIQVYSSSSKYRYYTFCTPECAVAIDNYLELRQRYGEKLIKTETGWGPQNAYLIIRAFNRKSFDFIPIPIRCRTSITTNIIVPKLEAINLRTRKPPSDKPFQKTTPRDRGDLHPAHSFRIFAITQMQRAKVDKTIREMLVGHSTGLDSVYYKASEDEIYLEYLKAIDNLQISNGHKSKPISRENKQEEQEEILKLKQKHEADLALFREDMNLKFDQIFTLIQQNPLLAHVKPEVLERTKEY